MGRRLSVCRISRTVASPGDAARPPETLQVVCLVEFGPSSAGPRLTRWVVAETKCVFGFVGLCTGVSVRLHGLSVHMFLVLHVSVCSTVGFVFVGRCVCGL